ncbi:MAG: hypothetical protein JKY54_06125, partial [Flavobacteriales bacterium]|nr:hypothetical protein [Flavobacteriales bacterium]
LPPESGDKDIEEVMNLLFALDSQSFAYPRFKFEPGIDTIKKPKVIVIGDSFYWAINNTYVPAKLFSETSQFWYYFKKSLPNSAGSSVPMSKIDIVEELKSADAIIMIVGSENINDFPFGFASFLENNKEQFKLP